jgi:hypothetical protein
MIITTNNRTDTIINSNITRISLGSKKMMMMSTTQNKCYWKGKLRCNNKCSSYIKGVTMDTITKENI